MKEKQKGFTLIELLIVVAVISIVSSVLIFNHRDFKDEIAVSNDAHKIVLALREVRLSAMVGKEVQSGNLDLTERFNRNYGLYFNSQTANRHSFVSFVDINGNGRYEEISTVDCGSDECLESVSLEDGNSVKSICKLNEDGSGECSAQLQRVHIVFKRPLGEVKITFFPLDLNDADDLGVIINLESPRGIKKSVIIKNTGVFLVE